MVRRTLASLSAAKLFACQERFLLRDYIQKSLYDPIHGYFSTSKSPLLGHRKKLKLHEIPSRAAYQQTVADTYGSAIHGWMTPVELFSPYLSHAVANRIQDVAPRDQKVNIIEIGAGRGTLAADVLEYWSTCAPDFLQNISYNIVEISPALAQLQSKVLQPWVETGRAEIHNADAIHWLTSLQNNIDPSERLRTSTCHIIGMEVLDNLPHDLVRVTGNGLQQATMVLGNDSDFDSTRAALEWSSEIEEVTRAAIDAFDCLNPFQDANIDSARSLHTSFLSRFRRHFEELLSGGTREIWVPTASFQLIQAICSSIPNAQMTLSDFNSFPGALPGENGPIVQSVERGSAIVYDGVENAPFGKVDVMFPTNFPALERCYQMLSQETVGREGSLYRSTSQQQFFEDYSSENAIKDSTCRDGYNPILQDFENASFFLVDAPGQERCFPA